jgi:tripartite-type tricarboxylate transporter receptor subunit TctC
MSSPVKASRAVSTLVAAGLALSALLPGSRAAADVWPNRPVRFIVTLGPGSGVDIGARLFADKLSARWGQPVVVENRPGGDGMVAITSFLSAHDDHTLLVSPVSSFTAHPYFHDKLPYDPQDLIPIARISKTVVAVSVPTSLNVNSLKELEALARAKPDQLNWTTATGFTDFVFAGYLHTVGLKMAKVPYKNPAGAVTDLASGTIQVYMPAYAIVRPQVEAGTVKVLAVTNHERAPALPNVPTAVEEGYPSLEFDGLVGLFGPPGIADDVRAKIAEDIRTAASDPELLKRLTATGQIVSPGNAAEFAVSIAQQRAQVAAVAKLFGNKPVQ